MQTPREPTSLKNRLLFLWCCCCACPVIGIVFITYACLDFFYTSIPENQTYTIAIVFFFVGIAIMATSCFCCCVILTKIYAPSDDPAGGTLGLGCDFRKVPHVVLGTGLGFSVLDNEESNDTSRPKGLEKAGLGATLIQWIYRPTPHSVQIINDLDLDISVMVEECSFIASSHRASVVNRRQRGLLVQVPAGQMRLVGGANTVTDGSQFRVQIMHTSSFPRIKKNRKGIFIIGRTKRLITKELAPNNTYRLHNNSEGNTSLDLVSSMVLPPGFRALHIELANDPGAEFESAVQWAVIVDDNHSPMHEDTAAYVVFRGTQTLADMAIDVGAAPYWCPELDLRLHGSMWAALHSHEVSVIDQILKVIKVHLLTKERRTSPRRGIAKLSIFGHSLGGGYALISALELLARGQDAEGFTFDPHPLTFGSPMVIVPTAQNQLCCALQDRAVLIVNAW